jgi:hypothetical protein
MKIIHLGYSGVNVPQENRPARPYGEQGFSYAPEKLPDGLLRNSYELDEPAGSSHNVAH